MDSLQPVLQPVLRVWRGLSRPQQIGLGLVLTALLGVLLLVSTVGHSSDMAVAFSGLSTDDEATVVAKLKDAKIPYQLADGGTVRVPSAQVQDARLALAGAGLSGQPAAGSGFELFNQPAFGQTEFTQKVNYQRALETELERSIDQMSAIDSARVHLVIPEQSLFSSQQKDATASIMIKLKPGKKIDSAQARSITTLVAGSVEGLKPQNVTLVDVNGNTLTPDDSADGQTGLTSKQLDTEHAYETQMQTNLQNMLDRVLGPGQATVQVSALMNWDQVEQTSETYSPNDPTQTPVLSSHQITETDSGSSAAGGVPGPAANNGAVPTYQGAGSGSGGSSKTDNQTTYQLNKQTQKLTRAPGAVQRLSVSVMLNDDPNSPNTALAQNVQAAVNAAAGIDPTRGDMLTVTPIQFNQQQLQSEQAAMVQQAQQDQLMSYAHLAVLALGPILMLVALFLVLGRGRKKPSAEVAASAAPGGLDAQAEAEDDAVAQPKPATSGRPGRTPAAQPISEDPQKLYIREQIQNLGKSNPATVAQLIHTWMDEDRRN